MKIKLRKILVLLVVCLMVLSIVGCNSQNTNEKDTAKKFNESELNCPNLLAADDLKKLDDNSIALMGVDKDYNFKIYISKDNGKTWTQKDMPQIDNNNKYVSIATIDKDRNIAFLESDKNASNKASDNVKNDFNLINKEGLKSTLNVNLSNKEMDEMNIMKFASNGDIIANLGDKVVQIDSKTGDIKYQYNVDKDNIIGICSISKYLILATSSGQVLKYDINTGKKLGEIKKLEKYILSNQSEVLLFSGTGKNELFLTCADGVIKCDLLHNSVKQVVQGENTSLEDRHLYFQQGMKIDEQNFLVAFQDDKDVVRLYKYSSSKGLAKNYSKKLKVYSLYSDNSVKDFIREYKKKHKDVDVKYEVGLDSTSTEDDAIKRLNTEIMAGKGPDVLFLEGLSSEYYQQKGVLLDITDIVNSKKDSLFNGVLSKYYYNNKIYMIPLRVEIPVVIGENNIINDIHDLGSLSETIDSKLSQQSKAIMPIYEPRDLVNLMYYTSSDKIIQNEKVNKEYLKEFLDNTKKIYNIVNSKISKSDKEARQEQVSSNPMLSDDGYASSQSTYLEKSQGAVNFIIPNMTQLDISYAKEFKDIATIQSITKSKGNLGFKSFSGDGENTFLPKEVVSINSKGNEKDLAKEFISSLLDDDGQVMEEGVGLPISKTALSKIYNEDIAKGSLGKVGIGGSDGDATFCDILPPNEQEFNNFVDIMNKLDKPANTNTDMLYTLTKATENYVSGKYTLDEAINYVSKKLNIKLSE